VLLLLPLTTEVVKGQQPNRSLRNLNNGPNVRFASGNSSLNIPFELFESLILVQVRVNNSRWLRFVLDTGADTSVIDARQAKLLRLRPQGKMVETGAAGVAEATFTKGVRVTLPRVELLNRTIYVLPLESLSALGRKIDGVLGNDILKEFVVEIDYAAKSINLYATQGYNYAGAGEIIPVTMEEELPFVRASITAEGRAPVEGVFEIDSGSTGAITLNTPFVNNHQLLESAGKTKEVQSGGVGGSGKVFIGRLNAAKLGRFELEHPITRFSQATQGDYASAKYDGLIGGEILRRFKVIVDYSRRQLVLEPNANLAEPYDVDMSGISLVLDGVNLLVDDVDEHSPAAEAGVLGGDLFLAIDGRPAPVLGLDRIRDMFKQDGKEYRLTVKRKKRTVQIKVKLRRLI
jgi:hypothetical protein